MTIAASTETIPMGSTPAPQRAGRLARLIRGRAENPPWERAARLLLLVLTALLYLVGLASSGWANSFYSAAVQAGSSNWEAFFYGSSDAGNSITVDKPPASLWVMDLSVRIFGLNSWAILVPEALMGIATVALVASTVRRHFSPVAALVAGTATAITPVAVLMFRFNNPDALLLLLVTAAVFFTLRGIETARMRWTVLAGAAIGAAFLTKELQAFLVVPVLVAVYLVAAPTTLWRRLGHLVAAAAAIVISAGWWVAIVQLVPASARPYIGGSQDNSFLQLTFGYNGFGRLNGDETGSVTGGGGAGGGNAGGQWGATGIGRMFGSEFGGQIAWLLPAALVLFVAALILTRNAPRTDLRRALILLLGGWMIVTGLAFSFMAGIIHPYYAVALAPPVAGTVAVCGSVVWQRRESVAVRALMAVTVFGTSIWACVLLSRATDWLPWLKLLVVAIGLVAGALLVLPPLTKRLSLFTAAVSLVAVLLAPLAYSLQTASTAHTGSIVSAGPAVASTMTGPGGGPGGFGGGNARNGARTAPGGGGTRMAPGGAGGTPGAGGAPGTGGAPGAGTVSRGGTGGAVGGQSARTGSGARPGGGAGGGLLNSSSVGSAVAAALKAHAKDYTWVAAAIGSQSAAGYQLATEEPVMPLGGFNGSDPSPTLAEFKADVAAGKIHYFIAGSVGAADGGSEDASRIASWVAKTFTSRTVDGVTLYDLTDPA